MLGGIQVAGSQVVFMAPSGSYGPLWLSGSRAVLRTEDDMARPSAKPS